MDNEEYEDKRKVQMEEVDSNRTLDGQLAFQSVEAAFDKTFKDTYFTSRRILKLKMESFVRMTYMNKLREFAINNGREPDTSECTTIMDEVRKIKIVQDILLLRVTDGRISKIFENHKTNSEDAWNQIMYEDMPRIEELDITISMMLEEIIPLRMPDGRDYARELGILKEEEEKDNGGDKRGEP